MDVDYKDETVSDKPGMPTHSSITGVPLADDESLVRTERVKELSVFLRSTPRKYDNRFTPNARYEILSSITQYLFNKDDSLIKLVPINRTDGRAPLILHGEDEDENDDSGDVEVEYTEVWRGRPCGHVFKQTELLYRCR